jgi:hypothetical protein
VPPHQPFGLPATLTHLRESEDIVDEEQHILVLHIAEVLRDREASQRHTGTCARGLVHLAIHQRTFALIALLACLDDTRLNHLIVKVSAFARALANAREHREATMPLGDIVDQLHDEHGLADASAAEESNLATTLVRGKKIDDLQHRPSLDTC